MDQANFEGLLRDFQAQCSAENTIYDLSAVAGHADAPVVVLVHGIGGNFRHWADPVSMNVNDTWLFDLNAQPAHGSKGVAMSPPYQPGSRASWTQFLSNNNVSYINFSQSKPGDLLEFAVAELVTILTTLERTVFSPYEQDVATYGGQVPPLIIVAHSRGGLVTRTALKQLGSAGVPHLRKVITLCTPHYGSYMPKLSDDYNNSIGNNMDFSSLGHSLPGPIHQFMEHTVDEYLSHLGNMVREAMLHSFGTLAQSPGFDELIPSSNTLQTLAQDEQPLPGVQYYGFGGSNPTFVNMFLCIAGQSIHLLSTASTFLVEMIGRTPGIHASYGGLAELDRGDSAVSLTSSHWPDPFGAPHQDFKLNHMQALIDQPLQEAVLQIIRS
jgi:pimeloyl-ACP methyl ester carboxylesterase